MVSVLPQSRRLRIVALITVNAAAERLTVSPYWLRRRIAEKSIPVVRLGRLVRIEESVIEGLIDEGRQPAESRSRAGAA